MNKKGRNRGRTKKMEGEGREEKRNRLRKSKRWEERAQE